MEKTVQSIFNCFNDSIKNVLTNIYVNESENLCEVRIRVNRPIVLITTKSRYFVTKNGELVNIRALCSDEVLLTANSIDINNAFIKLCDFSVYKRQIEINNGFITVDGGHRIGISGTCNILDNSIKSVTEITSLNIRIANEFVGCANEFMPYVVNGGGALICGVPSSGKTTLLRDIARQMSEKADINISLIDERFEIAAIFNGQPHFNLGLCDIYCGYPKKTGIIHSIRSMSPEYIICDELTGEDVEAVTKCANYGVSLIATVHCRSISALVKNSSLKLLLRTEAFKTIIFLEKNEKCRISNVVKLEELNID